MSMISIEGIRMTERKEEWDDSIRYLQANFKNNPLVLDKGK